MLKRYLATAAFFALIAGGQAQAANYGMAGCGLGSMLFKDQPGKIQILAATTNDYFLNTSAMSSGTSNCVDMPAREEASLFIMINQVALQKDISRGEGETLASLSKILQCSDSGKLGAALQGNYKAIFPANGTSPEQVSQSIDSTIRSDESLVRACGLYT